MKTMVVCMMLLMISSAFAQKEIPLYTGAIPGSETWTWEEQKSNKNRLKVMTVYNVVRPSLTVFAPDPDKANGTAVIVCPGGGFHFLAIDHEGTHPAKRLVEKGITVFVLKYRTFRVEGDNPFDDMLDAKDPKAWDDEALPVIPLAVADGRKAIEYVRSHANEYKIDSTRIGILGFSAGGLVAAATAFGYNKNNRPDFVAPIYADIPERILEMVAMDAPPLFLACTQDDEFGFATHAIRMYEKWYESKRPVEMHLFTRGGHGFGVGDPSNITGNWIDLFNKWLVTNELVGKM